MDSTLSTAGSDLSVRDAVSQAVHDSSPASRSDRGSSQRREQIEEQQARLEQQQPTDARESSARQETAAPANRAVRFRLNPEAERFYIEVVDQVTGEIVKQIPPESLMKLAESLRQATGNLLDKSA